VPKGTRRTCSRTSAFGLYNKPKATLRAAVQDLLAEVRHHRCKAEKSATGFMPIKRLRNRLIDAMCIHVACQPAQAVSSYEKLDKKGNKVTKHTLVVSPMWKLAPHGAFYKAKRVCSLVTDVVTLGGNPNLAHDLERLAINIWRMSKRHFDGLCRRIRSKLAASTSVDKIRKSPETVKRFEALMTNPFTPVKDEYRCSRHRVCSHSRRYAAMRLSTHVETVTESHKCKKCTASPKG